MQWLVKRLLITYLLSRAIFPLTGSDLPAEASQIVLARDLVRLTDERNSKNDQFTFVLVNTKVPVSWNELPSSSTDFEASRSTSCSVSIEVTLIRMNKLGKRRICIFKQDVMSEIFESVWDSKNLS
jgi:hypothetical protein